MICFYILNILWSNFKCRSLLTAVYFSSLHIFSNFGFGDFYFPYLFSIHFSSKNGHFQSLLSLKNWAHKKWSIAILLNIQRVDLKVSSFAPLKKTINLYEYIKKLLIYIIVLRYHYLWTNFFPCMVNMWMTDLLLNNSNNVFHILNGNSTRAYKIFDEYLERSKMTKYPLEIEGIEKS